MSEFYWFARLSRFRWYDAYSDPRVLGDWVGIGVFLPAGLVNLVLGDFFRGLAFLAIALVTFGFDMVVQKAAPASRQQALRESWRVLNIAAATIILLMVVILKV